MKPSSFNIALQMIVIAMLFALSSCNTCTKKTEMTNADTLSTDTLAAPPPDVSYNKQITDVAMFIAGLPVDSNSHLYELSLTSEWQAYSKRMNEKWKMFFEDVEKNIRPWVEKELNSTNQSFKTLFYPFSGPDFINANIFFPNMENYIFFGLEAPGSLPNPLAVNKSDLPSYYKMYEKSIEHIIYLSFFRTHAMKTDLSTMEVDGAAPVILIFMARAGKKIIDIKPFRFADNGSVIYDSIFNNFKPTEKFKNGIEITFRNENDPTVQKLIYFSFDISDGYLSKNAGVKNWLEQLDSSCAVYIKSASYLLHNSNFQTIRSLLLEKGKLILQDDSGIPYKFFNKDEWDVSLYGIYEKPIPLFANYFQQDLRNDYLASKPTELPFRRGYGKKSNLQLAKRKN